VWISFFILLHSSPNTCFLAQAAAFRDRAAKRLSLILSMLRLLREAGAPRTVEIRF
jgi:hypothetical protein